MPELDDEPLLPDDAFEFPAELEPVDELVEADELEVPLVELDEFDVLAEFDELELLLDEFELLDEVDELSSSSLFLELLDEDCVDFSVLSLEALILPPLCFKLQYPGSLSLSQ